jgi:hypothetical protein
VSNAAPLELDRGSYSERGLQLFLGRLRKGLKDLTFAKKWIDDGKPDLSPVVEIERAGPTVSLSKC